MTEACNYRCGYCYATWDTDCNSSELHRTEGHVRALLDQLSQYFYSDNPIRRQMGYTAVRINFAGGEPMLLGDRFTDALTYAKRLGFSTSIITNGHFLDDLRLIEVASHLDVLGISFDTADQLIAGSIGRMDRKSQWLKPQMLMHIAQLYRKLNPTGILKVNTVVNEHNWHEDLNQLMAVINPDKWKILRVLPVHNHKLAISDPQFESYVKRHSLFSHVTVKEDNDDMWQSYLMINPEGCFYQNSAPGQGHLISSSILDVGVATSIKQIPFNIDAFTRRYL